MDVPHSDLNNAHRARVVCETLRCEVVVHAKIPVLGVLEELPRVARRVSVVQGSVIVESHLLRPDHRQLQRDREVVLLAVHCKHTSVRLQSYCLVRTFCVRFPVYVLRIFPNVVFGASVTTQYCGAQTRE